MLSVINVSGYICTRVHLYTVVICADGAFIDMCQCLLLAAICLAGDMSLVMCIYVNIM